MRTLTGRTAIVTGSTSAFAGAGANFVLNGFDAPADIEKARAAIETAMVSSDRATLLVSCVNGNVQPRLTFDAPRSAWAMSGCPIASTTARWSSELPF